MGFHRENFGGLFARTAYCIPSLQTITQKTFADRAQNREIRKKVFSLESFSLYGSRVFC